MPPLAKTGVAVAWLLGITMPERYPFSSSDTVAVAPMAVVELSVMVTVGTGISASRVRVTWVGGAMTTDGET